LLVILLGSGTLAGTSCDLGTADSGREWTTYHRDNSRTANASGRAGFRTVSLAWRQSMLDGAVYAEPLIFQDRVYVVTENNSVYAFSVANGSIEWRLHLGPPAQDMAGHCTQYVPLGITSTPVIDPASSRLYAAGVVDTVAGRPRYQTWLFAVDLRMRSLVFHVPVDPPGANVDAANQRGALTLMGGRVYVPFGGRPGDCGEFHGAIRGVRSSDGSQPISFQDTRGEVTGGGFWASGGLAVDNSGDLLAASGNALMKGSFCGAPFQFQDTVMRLAPDLPARPVDYWTPANWRDLDCADADIGAVVPTVLTGTGLVFQSGKNGWAYLLKESALGHGAAPPFAANLGAGECRGGVASDGRSVFVGCQAAIFGLRLDEAHSSLLGAGRGGWRQATTPGCDAEPPIIALGAVWWLDRCHVVHANDPVTGRKLFTYDVGSGNHFATPAAAGRMVFVPIQSGVAAFALDSE
jgi:outer membrane protein assembly factor BamB